MALIYEPKVFGDCKDVRAGLSLRGSTRPPFGFNMSLSVGDDVAEVLANRTRLARKLGFDASRMATQRQVHGSAVAAVEAGYQPAESDAMLTDREGWLLAVSVADCVPVLMCDPLHRVVAAVHSGWRGTLRNIVGCTIERMRSTYATDPHDIRCYIGAAAGQCCYEVGDDVAQQFDHRFSRLTGGGKYLFDNKGCVLEQLISCGLQPHHIELDIGCTICNSGFHSYRRDGASSGRMLAAIGMTTAFANADALGTA